MNEDQKQTTAPVKTAETVKPEAVQSTAPVKETDTVKTQETVKPQAVQPTVQTPETAKSQSTAPTTPATVTSPEQVKPQAVQQPTIPVKTQESVASQPTQSTVQVTDPKQAAAPATSPEPVTSQPTNPTELPKLSDVVPTSKVWISGLIGNRQIDCLGPIEIPLEIDEPTYPFTPVPANSAYTNQVFDYDTSTWLPTDAKSQGQQLTDLTKEVADLQQAITKHDKDAEQSQAMVMQQMQTLMSINSKLDVLTKKDGVK